MAYFDDFANAVTAYPALSVTLSVVDVVVHPPDTGPAVNTGEVWTFQVRVANNGNLNLTDVALHVEGQNGATVSTFNGNFVTSMFPFALAAVNAHSSQDTVSYYFKAPGVAKPAGTALVRIHISTFNANLDYPLITNTGHADPPAGTYATQVFPS